MPRFFVSPSQIKNEIIQVTGEDVKHITKVLRLSAGDEITLCSGGGNEYICRIEAADSDKIDCRIEDVIRSVGEPELEVTLYQGFPKADKMEYIIQKCCEIGICRIVPVLTARTVVKWKKDGNKIERYRKIAVSAAKQSGRGRIPDIAEPVTFKEAIEELKTLDLQLMPYELETQTGLKQVLRNKGNIKTAGILIGPEGGFAEAEVDMAKMNGIETITLGKRILRCETAGAVVLGIIMYEFDEM